MPLIFISINVFFYIIELADPPGFGRVIKLKKSLVSALSVGLGYRVNCTVLSGCKCAMLGVVGYRNARGEGAFGQ